VKYLEILGEQDKNDVQKVEYSLEHHLAKNLIDLYVNLPSNSASIACFSSVYKCTR
jgi:hypothetical protein